jgi:hypothetical protein
MVVAILGEGRGRAAILVQLNAPTVEMRNWRASADLAVGLELVAGFTTH